MCGFLDAPRLPQNFPEALRVVGEAGRWWLFVGGKPNMKTQKHDETGRTSRARHTQNEHHTWPCRIKFNTFQHNILHQALERHEDAVKELEVRIRKRNIRGDRILVKDDASLASGIPCRASTFADMLQHSLHVLPVPPFLASKRKCRAPTVLDHTSWND